MPTNGFTKTLALSSSFGVNLLADDSNKNESYGGKIEVGFTYPHDYIFPNWPMRALGNSPLCLLGINKLCSDEAGFRVNVKEQPTESNTNIALNRVLQFGPYWRYNLTDLFFIGYHIDGTYTHKFSAVQATNTFTSSTNWLVQLIPEAGVNIPLFDSAKLQLTLEVDDMLIARGKPQPNAQFGLGIKMEFK